MTRPVPCLVFAVLLTVGVSASTGRAQAPGGPGPGPGSDPAGSGPDVLSGWPRVPDEPKSLFWQAPAPAPYACAPLPGRYFERDPLLDPPQFPQPGFVAGVEVQAVAPHIFNQLANGAPVGANPPDSIRVPVSGLNWGVSPRVEAGYRLGSGFGEFLLGYRYLGVTGASTTPLGPDGPASLRSRLDFNVIHLDYATREFTPWKHWGMKWRVGLQMVYLFYDSQLDQSPGVAAAGSGILQERAFNDFKGFGGHVGVELDRDLDSFLPGLAAVAKLDFGSTFTGRIKQGVSQKTVLGFASGGIDNSQTVPALAGQFGLSYTPPGDRLSLFVGGLYEYWWNVGRLSTFSVFSRGEMSISGVTARLTWNY